MFLTLLVHPRMWWLVRGGGGVLIKQARKKRGGKKAEGIAGKNRMESQTGAQMANRRSHSFFLSFSLSLSSSASSGGKVEGGRRRKVCLAYGGMGAGGVRGVGVGIGMSNLTVGVKMSISVRLWLDLVYTRRGFLVVLPISMTPAEHLFSPAPRRILTGFFLRMVAVSCWHISWHGSSLGFLDLRCVS